MSRQLHLDQGLSKLSEMLSDAVVVHSENKILQTNLSFKSTFGFNSEEQSNMSFLDIFEEESKNLVESSLHHSKQQLLEAVGARKDGLSFPIEMSTSELTSDATEKIFISVISDITNKKLVASASMDSTVRFSAVAESAPDAVVLLNETKNIIYWNKGAKNTFGYSENEVYSKQFQMLIPAEIEGNKQKNLEEIITMLAEENTVELVALNKNKQPLPVEMTLATWSTTEGTFFSAIIRDITERKNAEAEREKLIGNLQKALSELKTLRGLVPICCHCKKIRDDSGFWNQLELYIEEHSEAAFSHGICPECRDDLYGKLIKSK